MIGNQIHEFARELWPLNRSLTGEGNRQTLERIKERLPELKIKNIMSGTKAFDWTVPKEWNVNAAYIIDPNGKRICDFMVNNLHLIGYSIPFRGSLTLSDLQKYLYSLPNQPTAVPYVTSYYQERWGFCLSQNQRDNLIEGDYEIVVDSTLSEGELNYGELIIEGDSKEEVFLSTYICHPSMANNELSGPTVLTFLAKWLCGQSRNRYTYRIIFIPETIGSLCYLSKNLEHLKQNVCAGFNVSCVGDNRAYSYLPSRAKNTLSDLVAKHVLAHIDPNYVQYSWMDRGSDERQYCAPGIDLPIASIMRTKFGQYPEYHTSLDNLSDVVTPLGLNGGYWALRRALELLEKNKTYKANILGEPQMGKRGLYPTLSTKGASKEISLMMNILTYCDGTKSLLEIADEIEIACWEVYAVFDMLKQNNLISVVK